jgi:hypothetical protein
LNQGFTVQVVQQAANYLFAQAHTDFPLFPREWDIIGPLDILIETIRLSEGKRDIQPKSNRIALISKMLTIIFANSKFF